MKIKDKERRCGRSTLHVEHRWVGEDADTGQLTSFACDGSSNYIEAFRGEDGDPQDIDHERGKYDHPEGGQL